MMKYLIYVRNNLMLFSIYKVHFFFTSFGNVLYIFLVFFLWKSVYYNAPTLNGMTFDQAFVYMALGSSIYWINQSWLESTMSGSIISGEIVVRLIKPVSFHLQLLFQTIGYTLANTWSILIPAFLVILFLKIPLPVGLNLLFFMFSLPLSFFISFHIDYIVGLSAFYTDSIWGISILKETLVLFLSGGILPLNFFPPFWKRILEFFPFQAAYNIPLSIITSSSSNVFHYLWGIAVQLFWALFLFALSKILFRKAIRRITVSGG